MESVNRTVRRYVMTEAQRSRHLTLVGERIEEIDDMQCTRGVYVLLVSLKFKSGVNISAFMQQSDMYWEVGTAAESLKPLVVERVNWIIRGDAPWVVNVKLHPPLGRRFFEGVAWHEPRPVVPLASREEVRERFVRAREVWIRQRQLTLVIPSDDPRWPTRTFMKVFDPFARQFTPTGA